MRLRGERVDDGAGENEIEFGGLQDPIIAGAEQPEPFEHVSHCDDQQQGDRLNKCLHAVPPA